MGVLELLNLLLHVLGDCEELSVEGFQGRERVELGLFRNMMQG